MLIRVCPNCKGDGFWRVSKKDAYPELNVAGARVLRKANAPSPSLVDYYESIIGYEFDCHRCHGTGELNWQRGKSLPPASSKGSDAGI